MDWKTVFEEFQDHLAPMLDVYEQAVYLYILRCGRMQGDEEVLIGFRSARLKIARGAGSLDKPMSVNSCYKRVRSLESKGCICVLASEHSGTRIKLLLPSEIEGLIKQPPMDPDIGLEQMDFFTDPQNRRLILQREDEKCFYCRRSLTPSTFVVEHVVSRPAGDNTYRNVVAACRECNNKKNSLDADDLLRNLYRNGLLSAEEFAERRAQLDLLSKGDLKPPVA